MPPARRKKIGQEECLLQDSAGMAGSGGDVAVRKDKQRPEAAGGPGEKL